MAAYELATSTLGAPGEPLDQVVATLTQAGIRTVEVRAAADALVYAHMPPGRRVAVRQRLAEAGIEVLAVASSVKVAAVGSPSDRTRPLDELASLTTGWGIRQLKQDPVVVDLLAHLTLARDLGARRVRVFPGAVALPTTPDRVPAVIGDRGRVEELAARRLAYAVRATADFGVWLVLETHDSHPRGVDIARILHRVAELVPGQRLGAVWDALHPWRVGEAPADTWAALAPYVLDGRGYVQIKDVASPRTLTPVLQGKGTLPLAEIVEVLRAGGYAGPLSLEWERTWFPQIPPLPTALAAARRALDGVA